MNHSETEIRVISGYYKLAFLIDGLAMQIPSQKLLEELIRFPQDVKYYPDPSDPFNVDHYRIRDRDEDLDNQLLLQSRSNWIVGQLAEQIHNPSEFEKELFLWCDNLGVSSGTARYYLTIIKYCQKILPGASTNPERNSSLITTLIGLEPIESVDGEQQVYDFTVIRDRSGDTKYFDKTYLTIESRKRRFSEFREAIDWLGSLGKTTVFHNVMSKAIHDEAREINKNHEKKKKQRTDDRKSESTKDSNNTLDYRILTQCVFCNRFHLQEPKSKLSRYCDKEIRPRCYLKNKAWLQSLKTGIGADIKTETISPSGF